MKILTFALTLLFALACQRSETGSGSLEDVSAGGGAAETCLQLVGDSLYRDALTVCQQALAETPDSVVLRDALARAMEQVGDASDAATDALRQDAD